MRTTIFSFLLLTIGMCSVAQVPRIEINPNLQPKGELMLNELVESMEYIPLETNNKCLIGGVTATGFDVSDNYILVNCDKTKIYYLFRRDGRFVCQVGTTGQGPKEYLNVSRAFLDESQKQIILITRDPYRIKFYNLQGEYVDSKPIPKEAERGFYIRRYYNHFVNLNWTRVLPEFPYAFSVRDENMKLVSKASPIPVITSGTISAPILMAYLFDDQIHMRLSSLNDTLFAVQKDFSFVPKYVIDEGKYKITAALRHNLDEFMKNHSTSVQCVSFFETKDYLLFTYLYGVPPKGSKDGVVVHYAYYDKKSKKLLYFPADRAIPNDFNGGMPFWPMRQDNLNLYTFYNAHQFADFVNADKKITPKGSNQVVQAFAGFNGKLGPDDNPVLVIAKLKH